GNSDSTLCLRFLGPSYFPADHSESGPERPAPTLLFMSVLPVSGWVEVAWALFEDVFEFRSFTRQMPQATLCPVSPSEGPPVLFALNQTLLQHESVRAGSLQAPYTTEDLIKHYNCGDLNAVIFNHDTSQLPNFINTTLPPHEQVTAQEIDSYFRQELIYKRNERMGKRVMALLQENEDKICFFAFGAGHFLGNNTVIDILRQAGLEVDHTPAGQAIHSPATGSPAPPPEGTSTSPAPATPAAAVPAAPSATPTTPPEEEDPALSPHLLLPDSLSQLEEFGRQRKWHKRQSTHQRPRQFNDLWVRIEDSTTASPPPLPLQPTHSSGTAKPPFQLSDQLQQQDPPGSTSGSAPGRTHPTLGLLPVAATIAAPFLLHNLGPS
ncbi:metalloprotease TIKI2-like, partial [Carlito syrichta]|uniref:Metalloprotease TIKI n=1 Tax=Carlito syrichta TaxID=1868482 RepID=A0A3Q0DH80_CARSF